MPEEIIIAPQAALVTQKRGNYIVTAPNGASTELQRNTHFGNPVNEKTGKPVFPQPILYKGGAEQIIKDYHVQEHYVCESSIEDPENGFFFYRMRCELSAYNPDTDKSVVLTEGVGSANTRESKTGNQSGFDGANSALKKAKKRAMVDAAISLAGLSSIFTQDMENENFMSTAVSSAKAGPDDPITSKQRQRVFAIGNNAGMTTEQVKSWLIAKGFASVKDITQKDYDAVCDAIEKAGEK